MARYRIQLPTDYLEQQTKRNFCIFGPPGVGKTTMVAYAKTPLVLAVDPQGPISLLNNASLRNIPFVPLLTKADIDSIIKDIINKSNGMADYETFVVDTLSMTQTLDLIDLREGAQNAAGKASQNEWALTNQHMSDALFALITKANANIVVVCHDKRLYKKDAKNENVLVGIEPSVTPGTLEIIKRLFSGIYYYDVAGDGAKGVIRKLYIGAKTTKALTKDRYGLPDSLTNPTWADVENAIENVRARIAKEEANG